MTLQQAARRDDVAALRELLQTQEEDRTAALVTAAYCNHTECVKVLLESGAQVNKVDKTGITALVAAADTGMFSKTQDVMMVFLVGDVLQKAIV